MPPARDRESWGSSRIIRGIVLRVLLTSSPPIRGEEKIAAGVFKLHCQEPLTQLTYVFMNSRPMMKLPLAQRKQAVAIREPIEALETKSVNSS
jgi:hypothetical protein